MQQPTDPLDDQDLDDKEMSELVRRANLAFARAGVTVRDLLDALPAVHDEVLTEMYGKEFMDELARRFASVHGHNDESQSRGEQ